MKFFEDPDFFRPRLYWSLLAIIIAGINFLKYPQFWKLASLTGKGQGFILLLALFSLLLGNLYYKPLKKGFTFFILASFLALFLLAFSIYHAISSTPIPYLLYLDISFFIFTLLATYSHYQDKRRVEKVDRFWNS